MTGALLIFPAGMPRSLAFLSQATAGSARVIGASSLDYDPSRERYPAWAHLPYVTEPGFDEALAGVIAEHGVTRVFTPHPVVWERLRETLPRVAPQAGLANGRPEFEELDPYREARRLAREWRASPLAVGAGTVARRPLEEIELAALLRQFSNIPGQCDYAKLEALTAVARLCPPGDLVEIGSLWGKSAFALSWLARAFRLGKLLCVDPWSSGHLVQNDPGGAVDRFTARLDPEEALGVFQMNLLASGGGAVNYLRMASVEAAARYRSGLRVRNREFGSTRYRGSIALLHIDGNHQYEAARADIEAWAPRVAPGGWIVVDDYVWPFGDGPRRAADEFLSAHEEAWMDAFVAGGALFARATGRMAGPA
jgi:predicted O-methyltransferase YrrM